MRTFKNKYRKATGGKKVLRESKNWYISFEDNQQIRRRLKAFTSKVSTEQLADIIKAILNQELLSERRENFIKNVPSRIREKLIGFGVLGNVKKSKTLDEDKADFVEWLKTTKVRHGYNRAASHIRVVVSRINRIIEGCNIKKWADFNQSDIEMFLGGLSLKPRSYNGYVTAIKHFCSWSVDNDRIDKTLVGKLKTLVLPDSEYRRNLTDDEVGRLLTATENAPCRYNMSGHERAVLYLLLIETGIRRGAFMSLTVGDFDFDNCTVRADEANTKFHKKCLRYLKRHRAEQLKNFFRGKMPGCKLFDYPSTWRSADMVRADLKAAGISPLDKLGRRVDLHALKHTYTTALDATDATLAERMDLTGHSRKKTLTLGTYTHTDPERLRDIIEQLPDYQWPQRQAAVRTGTDNHVVKNNRVIEPSRKSTAESTTGLARIRTDSDKDGKQNGDTAQETRLAANNNGVELPITPLFVPSSVLNSRSMMKLS